MKIVLSGLKALVGGSTSGLGKAVATQLAACGAEVTIMARNRQKCEETVEELPKDAGQSHDYLIVDFMDFTGYQATIKDYFQNNETDILVNNTQGPLAGGALSKNVDDYQTAFDLLFKTYCETTLLALEGMKGKRFGRIINVSSMSVREPIPTLVLSNSLRAAVINWAKTLSIEIAPMGITVNNILTGSFDTERLRSLHTEQAKNKGVALEEWRNQVAEGIPAGRFGRPEEYGYLAAFLASSQAGYITGTNIPIDGGALHSV